MTFLGCSTSTRVSAIGWTTIFSYRHLPLPLRNYRLHWHHTLHTQMAVPNGHAVHLPFTEKWPLILILGQIWVSLFLCDFYVTSRKTNAKRHFVVYSLRSPSWVTSIGWTLPIILELFSVFVVESGMQIDTQPLQVNTMRLNVCRVLYGVASGGGGARKCSRRLPVLEHSRNARNLTARLWSISSSTYPTWIKLEIECVCCPVVANN